MVTPVAKLPSALLNDFGSITVIPRMVCGRTSDPRPELNNHARACPTFQWIGDGRQVCLGRLVRREQPLPAQRDAAQEPFLSHFHPGKSLRVTVRDDPEAALDRDFRANRYQISRTIGDKARQDTDTCTFNNQAVLRIDAG